MISVCIPTYNGERYIKEQLCSILHQLSEDDEIVVSDDSSSDRTVEIIRELDDKRIKLLVGNHFRSPIYNLENALKNARGEFIFLADQDDVWADDKVEVMMKYLKEYDCVVSDAHVVDSELNIIGNSFYSLRNSGKGIVKNLYKNTYLGCCMAIRRKMLKVILPFPKGIPMHDSWIGINCEIYGRSVFIEDKLVKYRRHGGNASATAEKSDQTIGEQIRQRAVLFLRLALRIFGL